MARTSAAHLDALGYVVLRDAFDPDALVTEFDATFRAGIREPEKFNSGSVGNRFRYVPMMCADTPVSLSLVVTFADLVADLVGTPILPGRAKGTEYLGSAAWHRDSSRPVRSIGVLCYLDALDGDSGALRVVPGSHHRPFGDSLEHLVAGGEELPGMVVPTAPGDAIVFDERLMHSTTGGGVRRQWRIDFIADTGAEDDVLRSYFAGTFAVGWDGGYDVDRFPSFGRSFRDLDPRWDHRLQSLGAYAAADAEEEAVRRVRSSRG